MEEQYGDRIGDPMLLARLVHTAGAIEQRLDRPQQRRQESALAVEHARHISAEPRHQRDDDRAIEEGFGSSR